MKTRRILIQMGRLNSKIWDKALGYAIQIFEESDEDSIDSVILVKSKRDIDRYEMLIGIDRKSRRLLRLGECIEFYPNMIMRLGAKNNIINFNKPTIIISICVGDKILELLEGINNLLGLIVVENCENSVIQWKDRWSPEYNGKVVEGEGVLIEDAVIVEALQQLFLILNKNNPCLMTADKEWARDTLYILWAKGHSVEPQTIKSWAIKDGWALGVANDLARIAKTTFNSKSTANLSIVPNAEERYRRWLRSMYKSKISIPEG